MLIFTVSLISLVIGFFVGFRYGSAYMANRFALTYGEVFAKVYELSKDQDYFDAKG